LRRMPFMAASLQMLVMSSPLQAQHRYTHHHAHTVLVNVHIERSTCSACVTTHNTAAVCGG
jgi:hypothetical protein